MTTTDDLVQLLTGAAAQAADLESRLLAAVKLVQQPAPAPQPPVRILPADGNLVTIAGKSFPLAAIDPTPSSNPAGAGFPGCRGANQLVAYTTAGAKTGVNEFGAETAVASGVTGTLVLGLAGGIAVPADGYVLSGHGAARDFLASVRPGSQVTVTHAAPSPVPTGRKTLGVYLMDGNGHVSQVPPQCNRIIVAFYQGTSLVEWGGDTPAQTAAALSQWHAADPANREILISLGGQGGKVDLASVPAGIAKIAQSFPVHGIDWDAEAFSYSPAQAVSIGKAVAAQLPRFTAQFVPPGGSPVKPALNAAKACQDAGLTVQFGQQLYCTTISDQDVISATQQAVSALGEPSVLVGMMLDDGYGSWTVDSAARRMKQVVAKWPGIGGSYLWEAARKGTVEWAAAVAPVLGL